MNSTKEGNEHVQDHPEHIFLSILHKFLSAYSFMGLASDVPRI